MRAFSPPPPAGLQVPDELLGAVEGGTLGPCVVGGRPPRWRAAAHGRRSLWFKAGTEDEGVVLCGDAQTFTVKTVDISNTLLMLPPDEATVVVVGGGAAGPSLTPCPPVVAGRAGPRV